MVLSVFILAYALGPLFLVCTDWSPFLRPILLIQIVTLDIQFSPRRAKTASGVLRFRLRRHD